MPSPKTLLTLKFSINKKEGTKETIIHCLKKQWRIVFPPYNLSLAVSQVPTWWFSYHRRKVWVGEH